MFIIDIRVPVVPSRRCRLLPKETARKTGRKTETERENDRNRERK